MNILEEAFGDYKPGLHDILKYAKAYDLEGEEHTLMAGAIGFHGGGLCIMVTGPSQAGKTHISEIVMSMVVPRNGTPKEISENRDLLLEDGGILQLEFGSKTALAYTEQKLAVAEQLYIPEYQKLVEDGNKLVQEVLKAFGENRNAYRDVTNMKSGGTDTQHMKKSNWWSNLATENPLKLDVETGNRVLPLHVDASAAQTKRIMMHKAKKEWLAWRQPQMEPENVILFKEFMRKYRANKTLGFENPFATYITEHYLPSKYIKSRRAIDFYLSFVRAIAKFNHLSVGRVSANDRVLVNIEDIYQTEEIYGTRCRFDMLQLDPNSMIIFDIFNKYQQDKESQKVTWNEDGRVMLDGNVIHKELHKHGINLKLKTVEAMLDEMQECGYVEYSTGIKQRGSKFMVVDVDKPVHSAIDYKAVFDYGSQLVKNDLPEVFDEWNEAQFVDGKLFARNPFTGEEVNLLDIEHRPKREVKEIEFETSAKAPKATGLDSFMTG